VKAPGKDCLAAPPDGLVLDYKRVSIRLYWSIPKDFIITHLEEWRCQDSARKKMLAAAIKLEIAAHADELRRHGVRNPVTQAKEEIAKRWQHASGAALDRWLHRNR